MAAELVASVTRNEAGLVRSLGRLDHLIPDMLRTGVLITPALPRYAIK